MLALPDNGMPRSINKHNITFEYLCDWIEGSILFDETEDEFSVMDVVDVLISEEIYDDQDFAEQIVVEGWNELTRRIEYVRPRRPFAVTNSELKRINSWQTAPAHSFCVLLSLSQCYRKWWDCVSSRDRNEQGELFELVTQESLREQFSDWQVKRTGWSPGNPTRFQEMVNQTAHWLGETSGHNFSNRTNLSSNRKDAGLDLLLYRPFSDHRGGIPVYLMQCASGQDWADKTNQLNIGLWKKLIDFTIPPQRALAIPFALSDSDFTEQSVLVEGLLLDRYRLLTAAKYRKQWESSSLKDRIIKWAMPKIEKLPLN